MGGFFPEFFFKEYFIDIQPFPCIFVYTVLKFLTVAEYELRSFVDGKRRVISPDMSHKGV